MSKSGSKYVRIVFVVTLVAAIGLIAAALMQGSGPPDVSGVWQLSTIAGVKVDPRSQDAGQTIEITKDGRFAWPSILITGTWKLSGSSVTLHPTAYDGKTRQTFHADNEAKFPGDASMQKVEDQTFRDIAVSVDAQAMTLTVTFGGVAQTFIKNHAVGQ